MAHCRCLSQSKGRLSSIIGKIRGLKNNDYKTRNTKIYNILKTSKSNGRQIFFHEPNHLDILIINNNNTKGHTANERPFPSQKRATAAAWKGRELHSKHSESPNNHSPLQNTIKAHLRTLFHQETLQRDH